MRQLVNFVTAASWPATPPGARTGGAFKTQAMLRGRSDMEAAAKTTPLQLAALRSGSSPKICSVQGALQVLRKLGAVNGSQLPPFFGGIAQAQGSGGAGEHCCGLQDPRRCEKVHLFILLTIESCASNFFRELWIASTLLQY